MSSDSPLQRARVAATAARLAIDAATAEVIGACEHAGVGVLVMKGATLTGWLYPPDEAHYLDADLLVRPGDEEAMGALLGAAGFAPTFDETAMPGWWREHSIEWLRPQDGVRIDLHRWIVGIGLDPAPAWEVLSREPELIELGGVALPAPARPARLAHVVLHAAQHGREVGKSLAHLERALEVVDEALWRRAAACAADLRATDGFAAGLRLVPAGEQLADRLGLPGVRSVDAVLRADTAPPVALGFEQLARADGVRARGAIVWRKLFPPRAFVVHWYPHAATSRRALAAAYVRRPLWVLARAPAAYRAWRRARRQALRDRP